MQPDAIVVRAFLARVRRRLAWISAVEGAAAGVAIALVTAILDRPTENSFARTLFLLVALVLLGAITRMFSMRERHARVAMLVERSAPQCRNLIVTADEIRPGGSVAEPIATLVYARAAQLARSLDPSALFPARNALIALAIGGALWAFAATRVATGHDVIPIHASSSPAVATIDRVDVSVVPPSYVKRPAQSVRDPGRIEALAGSRIKLTIHSRASRLVIETLESHDTLTASSSNTFTKELVARADGYIAAEPSTAAGKAGVRRLIGLSVTPDDRPKVRIRLPGKDVVFEDGHHTLDLAIDASDDIGLASLGVRYTKVSGSGERFTFSEGEVPIQISRSSDSAWAGRAQWRLDGLSLAAGDMVVYRAVATDHRPGATPSESDSFIAEILAPGGVAAPGFSLDPEQERYAVSQQMVILKTQRLAARRESMAADAYTSEAQDLAAEQRKVRAEFVFMMGGELADAPDPSGDINSLNEEAEAEGESDLLAGRGANQGRIALVRAIRSMSRASSALTTADLTTALPHERAALVQLEQAFSRSRILLRALTQRERLDLSRRLTGVLTDAARVRRPAPEPELETRAAALRRALATIAELAGTTQLVATSGRASTLAESVLRIDPSDKALQNVASTLNAAATAIGRSRSTDAHAQLDRAATAIAAALRSDIPTAPANAPSLGRGRVAGALTDALRAGRGTR